MCFDFSAEGGHADLNQSRTADRPVAKLTTPAKVARDDFGAKNDFMKGGK